jgi:hypothetical protein
MRSKIHKCEENGGNISYIINMQGDGYKGWYLHAGDQETDKISYCPYCGIELSTINLEEINGTGNVTSTG